jgi:hypothetical protein
LALGAEVLGRTQQQETDARVLPGCLATAGWAGEMGWCVRRMCEGEMAMLRRERRREVVGPGQREWPIWSLVGLHGMLCCLWL